VVESGQQPLWWQAGVIYQVYPRSFRDSNGDGTGDLAGVIEKLDYLSETLGVDAIWLSPFYPSPMADFGYDVADYCAVDPLFGDLATFDQLLAGAHARKIRVIIDFVPNHSSAQHPWFIESRSSRDNPKRDWYVWADAKADGSPPNNWFSIFGGSAWQWDETTGQYYLHSFLVEQPDLNWHNPEVRAAMLDAMRFWLARGVDGFRLDAIHCMVKDVELRDNPPNTEGVQLIHRPQEEFDQQIHLYDYATDALHDVLREMRAVLDEFPERAGIGEIHVFDWPKWASYYGQQLDELHLPFNFGLLGIEWDAAEVRALVAELERVIPAGGWPNYVLGNHDEPRIASRIGPEQARVAMMLLLTLRGTPTIYNGDELGMFDVPVALDAVQDPWGRKAGTMGRDPERSPMLWDASPHAGFTAPEATPWLPIEDGYELLNAEAQLADQTSMLTLTRRLLALRRTSPALTIGDYLEVAGAPDDCFVYERVSGADRYLIALNFTAEPRTLTLPSHPTGSVVLSTHLDRDGEELLTTFELRPHEGCVVHIAPL
jgi:alpha-glucosidase